MSTRKSVHGSPPKTTSPERQSLAAGIIGRGTTRPTVACLRRAGAPLALVAFFLTAAWIDVDAAAQPVKGDAYPTKPLRVIVPFPAGGGTDILARMIGAKLTEAWGQPVVVDNRPGGSTVIGTEIVSKAPADGYTVLFTASTHAVNASLYARLPYDSIRDFAPVTLLASAPNILVVHPSMPTRTLNEFIAFAKARPRQINYGSSGNSGTGHLAMEMLKSMTGIDLVHIPYKGGSPALNAVIAGEVSTLFNNIIAAVPQVKAGRLYALGVTSSRRSSAVPNVPTIAEAGVPGFEALAWFGVFAPAAAPPKIVARLNAEIARILRLPEIRKRLLIDGAEPVGNSPQEFAAVIRADIAKWARVIKAAGITPD